MPRSRVLVRTDQILEVHADKRDTWTIDVVQQRTIPSERTGWVVMLQQRFQLFLATHDRPCHMEPIDGDTRESGDDRTHRREIVESAAFL